MHLQGQPNTFRARGAATIASIPDAINAEPRSKVCGLQAIRASLGQVGPSACSGILWWPVAVQLRTLSVWTNLCLDPSNLLRIGLVSVSPWPALSRASLGQTYPELRTLYISKANAKAVLIGLGRSVALCYRSSTSYQLHERIRCICS